MLEWSISKRLYALGGSDVVSNVAQAVQSAVQNADRYYKVMGTEASKDPVTMANAFKVWSSHHVSLVGAR